MSCKISVSSQEIKNHIHVISSVTKLVVTVLPMEVAAVLVNNEPRVTFQTPKALESHKKPRPMMIHNPSLVRRLICRLRKMKMGRLAVMKSVITLSTSNHC